MSEFFFEKAYFEEKKAEIKKACKISFGIPLSISLDPDHDRHSVGPDLGLNCVQRLSKDHT